MKKQLVVGLLLLVALVSVGGTYFVMRNQLSTLKADFANRIVANEMRYTQELTAIKDEFHIMLAQMDDKVAEQKKTIAAQALADEMYKKATSDLLPNGATRYPKQRGEVLKMISPKGGEVMCLNREFEIKWEGSSKIKIVNLYLIDPKEGGKYLPIDSVPFDHGGVEGGTTGSYIWTVGKLPQDPYAAIQPFVMPGDAYQIQIGGSYPVSSLESLLVYDLHDKPLSIANCQ